MKRICAWCGTVLDGSQRYPLKNEPISHGICKVCAFSLLDGERQTLREFIEKLKEPVLFVTGDVFIEAANARASIAIGKEIDAIEGSHEGNVMECAYARLPGGCGKTEHCVDCRIRALVNHTFTTGEAVVRVEAYLDVLTPFELQRRRLSVSTEKVGDKVLLRLDCLEVIPKG
jgi:hypothetical protein